MTISILRTTDAWWVHGPDGATRITTSATTTQGLLADRDAIELARRNPAPVAVAGLAVTGLAQPGGAQESPFDALTQIPLPRLFCSYRQRHHFSRKLKPLIRAPTVRGVFGRPWPTPQMHPRCNTRNPLPAQDK